MLGGTVFTVLDLAQGDNQMRLEPNTRPYTASRSQKAYINGVLPMGLAGMPEVWCRLMRIFLFFMIFNEITCVTS